MGKFGKLFLLFVTAFVFSGCTRQAPPHLAVVTEVDVVCRRDGIPMERRYTSPEKMERLLNYLRMQENLGFAETDPERLVGDMYTIDVRLSDGQHHIYQQRADRYFSRDYRPWHSIDTEQAGMLENLLLRMPSD